MLKLTRYQQIFILLALAAIIFVIIFYFTHPSIDFNTLQTEEYPLQRDLSNLATQKLFNLTFRYLLNNMNVCNGSEEILAVFIVTSYFGNVETRSSMRRAFTEEDLEKYKLRRIFLLGEAPKDKYTTQQSVNDESQRFGDIVQGNFQEAYRNLTYKHIMGLKWSAQYCPNAKYIIKIDDDTVVDMYNLKVILASLQTLYKKDFIAGYKLREMKPIRDPANKWYVTQDEYSPSSYPTFVSGWFYITNPKFAKKLATFANYEKYFWIDDVFVTGILANKLKTKLFDISQYFVVNSEFLQCCLQDFDKGIECNIYVGPNGGDSSMFFKFNEGSRKCSIEKKCLKRTKPINETCVAEKKTNLGKGDAVISDFRLL